MAAQLGFSFRWVFQMPDQGVTFDSFGRPHSGVFVFNSGDAPARQVRFRGMCAVGSNVNIALSLDTCPWSVATSCHTQTPPLFFPFQGTETVGDQPLMAFGEVTWESPGDAGLDEGVAEYVETFCVVWQHGAWQNV